MALPPYDFLTSAPTDQLGTSLGKDFDYLNAFRSGQGIRNDFPVGPQLAVMPPPFKIGDNPDVTSDMNLAEYTNFLKYMGERGASGLIDPQNQVEKIDDVRIGKIILPPIAFGGEGGGGGDGGGGGGGVEGPIDYNNLTLRDQNTGTGINNTALQNSLSKGVGMQSIIDAYQKDIANSGTPEVSFQEYMNIKAPFGRIGNLKPGNRDFSKPAYMTPRSIADQNKILGYSFSKPQKTGILEKLKNFDLSKMPSLAFVKALLPKRDPRQGALENFYGDNFGTTSSGTVASGIMQGYNPVSGGLFGGETQYGLGPAMDEKMTNIRSMLDKKHSDYLKQTETKNFSSMDDEEFETFIKSIEGQKLFGYGKYSKPGHTTAAENYLKLKSIKQTQAQAMSAANAAIAEKQRQEFLKSDTRNDPVTGTVAIQQRIDRGDYDRSTPDRTRSSVTKSSAAKSKGVGGGGYTKSDTTRESYRGSANGGRIRYGTGGIVTL